MSWVPGALPTKLARNPHRRGGLAVESEIVPHPEIERLRSFLHALVDASGRSYRDLEQSLGLGHGYLSHLFAGRLELKFKHVFLLGAELGLSPTEFFQRAYPPVSHELGWPLREIETALDGAQVTLRPPPATRPVDRDALKALVHEILLELLPPGAEAVEPAAAETDSTQKKRRRSRRAPARRGKA